MDPFFGIPYSKKQSFCTVISCSLDVVYWLIHESTSRIGFKDKLISLIINDYDLDTRSILVCSASWLSDGVTWLNLTSLILTTKAGIWMRLIDA